MAKSRKRSRPADAWIAPPPLIVGAFPPLPAGNETSTPVAQRAAAPRKTHRKPTPTVAIRGEPERLKALSLRQPWAEEVLRGAKQEEYRSMPTKIRGKVYLYASRCRWPAEIEAQHADEVGYDVSELPRGVLIGTIEITDCRQRPDGFYAWQLENPVRLDPPLVPREKGQPVWFHPIGRP